MDPLRSITLKLASAEEIRRLSHGEVTVDGTFDQSGNPVPGGLFSPDIFGSEGRTFGHVELACPVIHPWYDEVVRLLTGIQDLSDGQAILDVLTRSGFDNLAPEAEPTDFPVRCALAMRKSGITPGSLVIQALPVVPPVMRPSMRVSEGTISSDLNELYLRVIARNNAVKSLRAGNQDRGPRAYLNDARGRLVEAVRALLGEPGVEGPLQSLTDLLTANNGYLRRNLSGKRMDYSGRTVIVAGPDLNLRQCGLPREMAAEMFKPIVVRKLQESGAASGPMDALEKMANEPDSPEVRSAVERAMSDRFVLLNRAPTLHRLGIQPFEPVLVDHRAIVVHPLTCYAYNADFDGDQMAVHLPISGSAQEEAARILDSAVTLVSPANGKAVASPVQDIVLGLWYLTADPTGAPGKDYDSATQLISEVDQGLLHTHTPIALADHDFSGQAKEKTSAGRVVFNSVLPAELRFVNERMDRKRLQGLVDACLERCGRVRTRELLDDLNRLGFKYVTQYAPSYGLGSVPLGARVEPILRTAMEQERELRSEELNADSRRDQLLDLWSKASSDATAELVSELANDDRGLNPLYATIESGARGSAYNIGMTFGICGPAWANPTGSGPRVSFEAACTSNYWQGLGQLEHYMRAFGANKSLIDTHVKIESTARLTKDLIYALQRIVVTSPDCGAAEGEKVTSIEFAGQMLCSLRDRIWGRVAAENVTDDAGKTIVRAGELISKAQADQVEASGIRKMKIRTVLTCKEPEGVCAACYGEDLACGGMVAVGSSVGVVAAQSVSEPATQLTMRTSYIPSKAMPGRHPSHPGGLSAMLDLFHGRSNAGINEIVERAIMILRFQGVEVSDKHFELIARAMHSFTRIQESGDTYFVAGEVVANDALAGENAKVLAEGGRPASGTPIALGIAAAAANSSSAIGAAACGDARKTLALAALEGARDPLKSTLERIIAGLAPEARLSAH